MIKRLNTKEQYFASTYEEAEDLMYKLIEDTGLGAIASHSIGQKSNKNGTYFVVTVSYKYNTPAGLMESEENGDVILDDVDVNDVDVEPIDDIEDITEDLENTDDTTEEEN